MESFKHTCIKPGCGKSYSDTDPDPYYCKECNDEKKAIAKEIDGKFANRERKQVKSGLEIYDEASKRGIGGFPNAGDIL